MGLVTGVALLIVVVAVMNGFERELRTRILHVVPHLIFINDRNDPDWRLHKAALEVADGVLEISPFAELEGLLYARGETRPVRILGLSQEAIPQGFAQMQAAQALPFPRENQLLLSQSMATDLGVAVGQSVRFIFPGSESARTQLQHFNVIGVFTTHTELDQIMALGELSAVAEIAGVLPGVSGLRAQLTDPFDARRQGFNLLGSLPEGYGFRDWFQTHGNLYQAIQLSRNMVGLLIFMIVAIAAFNVVSMLMMSVIDKRRDIAVLKTLGLSTRSIVQVFFVQGLLIGLAGISLGVILGVLGCQWLAELIIWIEDISGTVFLDTKVYPIDYVPVDLRVGDVATIALMSALLNTLATVFPALRASRINPAEELRF